MKCGTVIYDKNFQFHDGSTKDKLAIIVAEFGSNYLVVKTTTNQRSRNAVRGCQISDKLPNYYLPKNSSWFDDNSWIELNEVFEIDGNVLQSKVKSGALTIYENVLPDSLIKEILHCALQSVDIDTFYLEFIERAYNAL